MISTHKLSTMLGPELIKELVEIHKYHNYHDLMYSQLLAGNSVKRKPGAVTSDVKNKPPTLLTVT